MSIPGNLLSATTEMVDPDVSGWAATLNCTISLGSGGRNGNGCLTITAVAAGDMQAATAASYPVTPGVLYEAFADASSTTQPERIGIRWLSSTGTEISTTWSLTTNSFTSSWHRIAVGGTAPVGTATALVVIDATATAAAAKTYVENVYLGPPQRTSGNLLSFNAESAEVDATAWAAEANATITRDVPAYTWAVDYYLAGGHMIKMTAVAAGNSSAKCAEQPTVTPGTEYLGYCYLTPPTSTASCWVELRWLDSTGTLISSKRATLAQPGTSIYRQRVSGIAPAGAATAVLAAGITSATAGQILRIDGAVLTVAAPIVDGSVMPYEDSSFEQGVGAWSVASGVATIARSTPWTSSSYDGDYYLAVSSSTATTSVLRSGRYPVTPNQSWRAQMRIMSDVGTWLVAPQIHWYDASGVSISVSTIAADSLPADGSWWREWNDIVAPANAATGAIELSVTAPSAGATLRIDSAVLLATLPANQTTADDDLGNVTVTMRELLTGRLFTLWRIAGNAQALVRGPDGWLQDYTLPSDQLTVEDYEAPLGMPVSYRYTMTNASTGADSGGGTIGPVTVNLPDISDCWIKDVLAPQRNVRLRASAAPEWTRPVEATEYRIRGRRNSVILSDVRGGLVGTLQLWTTTDDERTALHFALDDAATLLLQFAPGLGLDDTYVAVGEVTEGRLVRYATEPRRLWQLPLTQQDAPIGGVGGTAGWTVQDVATTWSTVTDVFTTYATVLDLVLDTRTS